HSLSLSFFSTIRPPPTSTLFPYTTLFRSVHLVQREPRAGARVALLADEDAAERDGHRRAYFRAQRDLFPFRKRAARLLMLDRRRDRKSTRLNSSHSQISYAVFCLKKKKTK